MPRFEQRELMLGPTSILNMLKPPTAFEHHSRVNAKISFAGEWLFDFVSESIWMRKPFHHTRRKPVKLFLQFLLIHGGWRK